MLPFSTSNPMDTSSITGKSDASQNIVTATKPGNSSSSSSSVNLSSYDSWNGDWLGYLTYMAEHGDAASQDKLFNYLMSEQSAQTARDWTSSREDSAVQRFVQDAKAAGINPYVLLSGGSPIASSSSGNGYSGTSYTTQRHQEQTEAQGWLKSLVSMIPMVLAVIAAVA